MKSSIISMNLQMLLVPNLKFLQALMNRLALVHIWVLTGLGHDTHYSKLTQSMKIPNNTTCHLQTCKASVNITKSPLVYVRRSDLGGTGYAYNVDVLLLLELVPRYRGEKH